MKTLKGALKSVTIWVNATLLAIFPFANDILLCIQDNLPQIAQYLPENMFKTLGFIVVVFNIFQITITTQSLKAKGEK